MKENKSAKGQFLRRLLSILMAALIAAAYLPVSNTYAAKDDKKSDQKKAASAAAEESEEQEETIREVHKVPIGSKRYCFFVTHNVVMTPKEIAKFSDDGKLTDEILKRAGLYMKEENCKLESHEAITPKEWKKKIGTLSLSPVEIYEEGAATADDTEDSADAEDAAGTADAADATDATDTTDADDAASKEDNSGEDASGETAGEDTSTADTTEEAENTDDEASAVEESEETAGGSIVTVEAVEALRKATPTDGNPSRFYTDLVITAKPSKDDSSSETKKYTTFKKKSPNSPKLIYIAVATEKDAALGEDICEEPKADDRSGKDSPGKDDLSDSAGEEEEMLPEYRTISMTDRSGGPLEPTLKDGDPVTLEWKEPGRQTDSGSSAGLFDHAWAAPALIAALALVAALVLILRKRRAGQDD